MAKKEFFRKKRIKIGDYAFVFREADTQAYLNELKDGNSLEFIMEITAFDKNDMPVAYY